MWGSDPHVHVTEVKEVTFTLYKCFVYGTGTWSKVQHASCTVAQKLFAHPEYVFTSNLVVVDTTMSLLIPILLHSFFLYLRCGSTQCLLFSMRKFRHALDRFDSRIPEASFETTLLKGNVFPYARQRHEAMEKYLH